MVIEIGQELTVGPERAVLFATPASVDPCNPNNCNGVGWTISARWSSWRWRPCRG